MSNLNSASENQSVKIKINNEEYDIADLRYKHIYALELCKDERDIEKFLDKNVVCKDDKKIINPKIKMDFLNSYMCFAGVRYTPCDNNLDGKNIKIDNERWEETKRSYVSRKWRQIACKYSYVNEYI